MSFGSQVMQRSMSIGVVLMSSNRSLTQPPTRKIFSLLSFFWIYEIWLSKIVRFLKFNILFFTTK